MASSSPDGTRPWRKSWRRKWRDGSSYRSLSLIQRELLRWVEENADDEGRAGPTTVRWLADLFSSPYERISKSAVHRAAEALERAKLVTRTPGQDPGQTAGQDPGLRPTVYVRVNWKEYQDKKEDAGQDPGQDPGLIPGPSSRGRQKKAEEKKGAATAAAPGWQELVSGIDGLWLAKYQGQKYVWAGREFAALKRIRSSLPDAEILRRFGNYLTNRDPFYAGHPVATFCSQVNRFVAGGVPDIRVGSAPAESHESFKNRGGGIQPW